MFIQVLRTPTDGVSGADALKGLKTDQIFKNEQGASGGTMGCVYACEYQLREKLQHFGLTKENIAT